MILHRLRLCVLARERCRPSEDQLRELATVLGVGRYDRIVSKHTR
jgi:hypothetical protein